MLQLDREPVLRIMERATDAGTVDLRRVNFLDCLGLRLLLEQHERSEQRGCHIDFVPGPPAVRRIFELTGALERLRFVEDGARRLASTG